MSQEERDNSNSARIENDPDLSPWYVEDGGDSKGSVNIEEEEDKQGSFKNGNITLNLQNLKTKQSKSRYEANKQLSSTGVERPSISDLRLKGVAGERIRRIVSDIIYLEKVDPSWKSFNAIENIKKYHKFTIEQVVRIVKGLEGNGIEFNISDYKITTEKPSHRYYFRDINKEEYEMIFGALTEYQCRLFRAIQAMKDLKEKDDVIDIDYKIGSYLKVMAFTPKELHFFFSKMDYYKINYRKSDFRISIKRDKDKSQFEFLGEKKIKKIWPAMTDYQKGIYNDEYSDIPIPIDYNHNK